jgi:squalene-hopene/tetraprenyl-beta-curcumene cyclase
MAGFAGTTAAWTASAAPPDEKSQTLAEEMAPVVDRALAFLENTQRADGGWPGGGSASDPAITGLAAKGFIQHPQYGPHHPVVQRAIELMLTFAQENGGIYSHDRGLRNYQTSACLMALAATKEPRYRARIDAAQQYLVEQQFDEGEGFESNHTWYGGAGYGNNKRPDLSNTQMMLEALHESGLPADHPVYRKAMTFIRRSQMLGTTNDQAFAAGSNDGGFIYTPASDGESKAGDFETEGKLRLRTYGSMTYAGFKSMLYADVDRKDERVVKALDWIRSYYTLESNPNMPGAQSKEGLYYYYLVFAKALGAWGQDTITDARGVTHDWRRELCSQLKDRQRADGSFVNTEDRWMEGNPYLVTAYSVLAIQAALEPTR